LSLNKGSVVSIAKRLLPGFILGAALVVAVLSARQSSWTAPFQVPSFRQQGPASAPVLLVEFSDFECANCAKARIAVHELLERQKGRVRLQFRHFPLKTHRWSSMAALAADCAGVQGRFWEYHDLLFENQKEWAKADDARGFFIEYARRTGLDMERFRQDLAGGRWMPLVQNDLEDGKSRGVNATPTFFIGARRLVGESQLRAYGDQFVEIEGPK